MATRQGRNPPEPLVGTELLNWLQWVNTPQAIQPSSTMSTIMYEAGKQEIITQLRGLFDKQQARGKAIASDEHEVHEVIEFPNAPRTPYTES